MNDTPCTQEQRDAIVAAAVDRARYILDVARILETEPSRRTCAIAAKLLRELVSHD
jgi:hypothetical protein